MVMKIVGPSDVTDALVDFFHWVFVSVGFGVEPSEVLDNPEALSRFLGDTENRRVVGQFGASDYPQLEPFS